MGVHTPSRRGLLGAIALAPLMAAPAAVSAVAPASPFALAFAKYEAALAAENAFDETYCLSANVAADAAEKRFPHATMSVCGRKVSTADWREVGRIRASLESTRYLEECAWTIHKEGMAFVDAADARHAAVAALPEVIKAEALTKRSDELLEVRCKFRDAAIEAPVTNLAELARKFALLDDGDGGVLEHFLPAFRADLDRLQKKEIE